MRLETSAPATKWLLRPPAEEPAARIFCFPYAGIGASLFNRWPAVLRGAEICPIQPPGRENRIREPHFGGYPELAESLCAELPPWLDRPSVFFGHCSGALMAYETALRLAEHGLPTPVHLVFSAQAPPYDQWHDRYQDLGDDALQAELAKQAQALGGRPDPRLLEFALALLRRDLEADRDYALDAPVPAPCGITAVHWTDDPETPERALEGWRAADPGLRLVELPGDHFQVRSAPAGLLDLLTLDPIGAAAQPDEGA